ncbi:MAG TPA: hypothetical protein VJK54_02935, partial [Chthoniobacterales bacterium]|nr:hypothetical protein [Chthoniobacterales bacterium]
MIQEEGQVIAVNSGAIPVALMYEGSVSQEVPQLMMTSEELQELNKGVTAAEKLLTGKRSGTSPASTEQSVSGKKSGNTASSSVSSSPSFHQKSVTPQKSVTISSHTSESEEGFSSDVDSSEEEDIKDVLNAHIEDAIETEGRAHVASNLFEKSLQAKRDFKKQRDLASAHTDKEARSVSSVDSTWIQNTLYKTAQMKLGVTLKQEQLNLQNANSPSKESQGLAAKEKMASLRLNQAGLALTKAQRAEETAKARLIKEEETHKEALTDSSLTVFDQEDSSVNIIYQRALAVYATSDHELKKLMRDLAEAKLATLNAHLMIHEAQQIEDDLSLLSEAETALELAREAEEVAEAATDPIANEAAARNSWCESLKRALETTTSANALRKEIETSVSLSSPLSCSMGNDILQEAHDTEQAWSEVVEICNNALDKKPALKLKNAWRKDLEEAVNQHSLWQVRVLWAK